MLPANEACGGASGPPSRTACHRPPPTSRTIPLRPHDAGAETKKTAIAREGKSNAKKHPSTTSLRPSPTPLPVSRSCATSAAKHPQEERNGSVSAVPHTVAAADVAVTVEAISAAPKEKKKRKEKPIGNRRHVEVHTPSTAAISPCRAAFSSRRPATPTPKGERGWEEEEELPFSFPPETSLLFVSSASTPPSPVPPIGSLPLPLRSAPSSPSAASLAAFHGLSARSPCRSVPPTLPSTREDPTREKGTWLCGDVGSRLRSGRMGATHRRPLACLSTPMGGMGTPVQGAISARRFGSTSPFPSPLGGVAAALPRSPTPIPSAMGSPSSPMTSARPSASTVVRPMAVATPMPKKARPTAVPDDRPRLSSLASSSFSSSSSSGSFFFHSSSVSSPAGGAKPSDALSTPHVPLPASPPMASAGSGDASSSSPSFDSPMAVMRQDRRWKPEEMNEEEEAKRPRKSTPDSGDIDRMPRLTEEWLPSSSSCPTFRYSGEADSRGSGPAAPSPSWTYPWTGVRIASMRSTTSSQSSGSGRRPREEGAVGCGNAEARRSCRFDGGNRSSTLLRRHGSAVRSAPSMAPPTRSAAGSHSRAEKKNDDEEEKEEAAAPPVSQHSARHTTECVLQPLAHGRQKVPPREAECEWGIGTLHALEPHRLCTPLVQHGAVEEEGEGGDDPRNRKEKAGSVEMAVHPAEAPRPPAVPPVLRGSPSSGGIGTPRHPTPSSAVPRSPKKTMRDEETVGTPFGASLLLSSVQRMVSSVLSPPEEAAEPPSLWQRRYTTQLMLAQRQLQSLFDVGTMASEDATATRPHRVATSMDVHAAGEEGGDGRPVSGGPRGAWKANAAEWYVNALKKWLAAIADTCAAPMVPVEEEEAAGSAASATAHGGVSSLHSSVQPTIEVCLHALHVALREVVQAQWKLSCREAQAFTSPLTPMKNEEEAEEEEEDRRAVHQKWATVWAALLPFGSSSSSFFSHTRTTAEWSHPMDPPCAMGEGSPVVGCTAAMARWTDANGSTTTAFSGDPLFFVADRQAWATAMARERHDGRDGKNGWSSSSSFPRLRFPWERQERPTTTSQDDGEDAKREIVRPTAQLGWPLAPFAPLPHPHIWTGDAFRSAEDAPTVEVVEEPPPFPTDPPLTSWCQRCLSSLAQAVREWDAHVVETARCAVQRPTRRPHEEKEDHATSETGGMEKGSTTWSSGVYEHPIDACPSPMAEDDAEEKGVRDVAHWCHTTLAGTTCFVWYVQEALPWFLLLHLLSSVPTRVENANAGNTSTDDAEERSGETL